MSTSLCIKISSGIRQQKEEFKFFEADTWTVDTEKEMLARIQEVLSMLRTIGFSFRLTFDVEVSDYDAAVFIVNKKINCQFEVNHQKLTVREIEVLGLIMQGLTNHEIAEKLFISYETVRSHRKNILEKTGAKNTVALINYYHQTFFEK